MHQPLFIHSSNSFGSRIRQDAGANALVTSSMLQALRWITNPEIVISGIYLNPNDSSYSALRFLELTLLQRPVTPIFLLDEENEISTPTQRQFFENVAIRGFFSGRESFTELLSPLDSNGHPTLSEIKKRITTRSEHPGYLAVPLVDFTHSKSFPLDVFVEDGRKQLRLFATAGSPIERDYLTQVSSQTSWMFVSESNVQELRDSIRQTQNNYMDLDTFPISWKTAETLFNAKVLLKELQKGGLSDGFVEHTQYLLSDIFQIVSHIDQSPKMQRFIDQAKECDRNIACATLAILMCKSLKFEKNAIVEILGLASFFQDVSLYHSPYGNLSDLRTDEIPSEALQYYLQHSMHSADFLAQHTSMPDVTLQVLRQHHERKDRTGFPNRIGGMQLHPMAEVLSLINAYLDHPADFSRYEKDIYSHYSDRMVIAFKQLLVMIEKSKTAPLEKVAA